MWYPSVRVCQQLEFGQWQGSVEQVLKEIIQVEEMSEVQQSKSLSAG
jgi:hypothetical protein